MEDVGFGVLFGVANVSFVLERYSSSGPIPAVFKNL